MHSPAAGSWRRAEHETATPLLAELRQVSRQLSAATLTPAGQADSRRRRDMIGELAARRERLESELARLLAEKQSLTSGSVRDVQAALPAGVVLVDFLEYYRSAPPPTAAGPAFQPRREVLAFVLRSEGRIARVDLGEADLLSRHVDSWRRTCGAAGQGAAAGKQIRAAVWEPIVAQAGPFHTALLSPDGALTKLPFNALPGKRRGAYLIEEVLLVTAPVPRLLPDFSAHAAAARQAEATSQTRVPRGLLLLGDVDFGTASAPDAPPGQGLPRSFPPLANSRSEILAVRDSFEQAYGSSSEVVTLRGDAATERRFVEQAKNARYLHLATHGFFVPQQASTGASKPSAAASGTLCGLALSQANQQDHEPDRLIGGIDEEVPEDGLLTALEVEALDLRQADLVVLSACETGLGEIAAGEGVLGLQRAFHTAGARTVVASLWKVEDRATRELMERFYENLWNAERPMTRSEALRQAQIALLRKARTRGVSLVDQQGAAEAGTPPCFWAAFILSGDWR